MATGLTILACPTALHTVVEVTVTPKPMKDGEVAAAPHRYILAVQRQTDVAVYGDADITIRELPDTFLVV